MDVTIGEVQAQVESQTPRQARASDEHGGQLGPTERAHRARLESKRNKRLRERLSAT
jgi:hypothetical protein